jgi:putative ABC transport system permease protein
MLHDLMSDLRSALRMFRRNPGTSSLIVTTLALAIGAATIAFAFADLALFRGLPVDDPRRVVSIFASDMHGENRRTRVSAPDYLDYRDRSQTLERISAFRQGRAPLIKDGQSRTLTVTWATGDFFAAMGQPAVQGRTLVKADDAPGAPPVVLLAHRYWQEEFGGRPDAIGRTMQIGRDIFTVVGVLTPDMEFGNLAEIDVWLPLHVTPDVPRDVRDLRFVARLRDGVTFDQAAAEMASISSALETEYPDSNAGWRVRLVPIRDITGGDGFWVVVALFILSIGLLIAIATANVSNLVMVGAMARQRELAVRRALGARHGRLIRQLVIEGVMLSGAAALLAILAAWVGLQLVGAVSAEPVFHQLVLDVHEFTFVATLALVCPLLFSFAPARTLGRTDMRQVLAAGGMRGSTSSTRGRAALVVAQVALAVVLLTTSSLALRSIRQFYAAPTGMVTSGSLVFTLDFNDVQYPTADQSRGAALVTHEALGQIPRVETAAMITALPILGSESVASITIDNDARPAGEAKPTAILTGATAEVASALGLKMQAGTWWAPGASNVAVISRQTATRYFGGVEQAVGHHLSYTQGSSTVTAQVIGVSNDVISGQFEHGSPPRVWIAMSEAPRRLTFILKATDDAAALSGDVRAVVARTAPAVPIEYLETFDAGLRRARSSDYMIIGLLAAFAVLAVALASTGLFGVVSYTAAQRTAEFGTRMALGANAWDVVRLVVGQSLRMLVVGLGLGLAGGIAVGIAMRTMLNGLSPTDPVSIVGVIALLSVVSLTATAIPAFRASRIDPVVALRSE